MWSTYKFRNVQPPFCTNDYCISDHVLMVVIPHQCSWLIIPSQIQWKLCQDVLTDPGNVNASD